MGNFEVTIIKKETYVIPVSAANEERAKEIARIMYDKRKEVFYEGFVTETEVEEL